MDYTEGGGSRVRTRVRHVGYTFRETFAPRWGSCAVDPENGTSLLWFHLGQGNGGAGGTPFMVKADV